MSLQVSTKPSNRKPPSNLSIRAGALLRQKRIKLGASQDDVATAMGCTFQAYQKYESGIVSINIPRLVKLGKIIGFRPAEFLQELLMDRTSLTTVKAQSADPDIARVCTAMKEIADKGDKVLVLNLARRLAKKS